MSAIPVWDEIPVLREVYRAFLDAFATELNWTKPERGTEDEYGVLNSFCYQIRGTDKRTTSKNSCLVLNFWFSLATPKQMDEIRLRDLRHPTEEATACGHNGKWLLQKVKEVSNKTGIIVTLKDESEMVLAEDAFKEPVHFFFWRILLNDTSWYNDEGFITQPRVQASQNKRNAMAANAMVDGDHRQKTYYSLVLDWMRSLGFDDPAKVSYRDLARATNALMKNKEVPKEKLSKVMEAYYKYQKAFVVGDKRNKSNNIVFANGGNSFQYIHYGLTYTPPKLRERDNEASNEESEGRKNAEREADQQRRKAESDERKRSEERKRVSDERKRVAQERERVAGSEERKRVSDERKRLEERKRVSDERKRVAQRQPPQPQQPQQNPQEQQQNPQEQQQPRQREPPRQGQEPQEKRKRLALAKIKKEWLAMQQPGSTVSTSTKELYRAIIETATRGERVRSQKILDLPCLAPEAKRDDKTLQCRLGQTRKKRALTTACKPGLTRWTEFDNRCHIGEAPTAECSRWFRQYRGAMNRSRNLRRQNKNKN